MSSRTCNICTIIKIVAFLVEIFFNNLKARINCKEFNRDGVKNEYVSVLIVSLSPPFALTHRLTSATAMSRHL